jgi:hypothetical protein
MLVVTFAYSAHLDLCLYFYCICFIIVFQHGNASKPVVVVWGCYNPPATVARVMSDEHYNILFRRALVDDKLQKWLKLIGKINNVTLDQERDMFR